MADFFVRRVGNSLVPDGPDCASVLAKIPFGKLIHVTIKQPRNGAHHRLYWALCARIADAIGAEAEDISDLLKSRTGHVRRLKTRRGIEEFPKSISFAAMDQTAFSTFFEKCVTIIYTEFGIARADILECVKDLLEDREAA